MIEAVRTRQHAALRLAVASILTAATAVACNSTIVIPSQGARLTNGSRAVTLVNLHAENHRLSALNSQAGDLIPVCTDVTIIAVNKKRLTFRVDGVSQPYVYDFHKVAAEPFAQHLARYFGSRCPRDGIARMSPLDQAGIAAGKPYVGMTKSAITIAMGYPPRHKTPNLTAASWRYWRGRRGLAIVFDGDGRMSGAKGLKRGTYEAPKELTAYASTPPPAPADRRASPAPAYTPPPPQTAVRREPPRLDAATGSALYSKRVAVVVGINQYQHWPTLSGAANDGRRMARFLRDQGWDEVIEVYDGNATRRRMLKVLGTELPSIADRDTLAMIYFAGHGQTETLPNGGKRGYLIPVDADTDDVFSTAISMDTVRDLSKRTAAKHVYYAIDACYSGLALTRGITRPGNAPPNVYLRKITKIPAVQIITAGADGEQAIEVGGQGLFTTYLLRALQGEADFNQDGAVTASEIGAYVKPQVTTASRNQQTPQFGTMEGGGEIVFMPRR